MNEPKLARLTITVTWNDGIDRILDYNTEQLADMGTQFAAVLEVYRTLLALLRSRVQSPTP